MIINDKLAIQYAIPRWDEENLDALHWHTKKAVQELGYEMMKYLLNHPEGVREVIVKERKENIEDITKHTITVYFWRDEIK